MPALAPRRQPDLPFELTKAIKAHENYLTGNQGGRRLMLKGEKFEGRTFDDLNLHQATLSGSSFAKAFLRGVNLTHADLFACDFAMADLRESDLSKADLRGANFTLANLAGTTMHRFTRLRRT